MAFVESLKVKLSTLGTDKELDGILQAMRETTNNDGQAAFSETDLDAAAEAYTVLNKNVEDRTKWTAAPNRGLFFVFEGLDRSGKSTQSKLLHKHLENAGKVKWMCFPNRETASGQVIDQYLRKQIDLSDEAIHLLFSVNRWETVSKMVEELNQGTSIVCDRYAFSGVAYTAAKGLDFTWCQAPDRGLPIPDGVFFLHVDESVGASRQNFGDERYENTDLQSRVRQQFKNSALYQGVQWHDVDGARSIEVISAEIQGAVQSIIQAEQENGVRPIRRLWAA